MLDTVRSRQTMCVQVALHFVVLFFRPVERTNNRTTPAALAHNILIEASAIILKDKRNSAAVPHIFDLHSDVVPTTSTLTHD